VIARNSTFTYKGKAVDVKQVGRELGVRYVLEGSVRKAGNRVRVTGQLIDAADGAHIWADRFDRDLTDIFAVQDELTQEIISALKVKLTPEKKDRLVRKGTLDVEGYNLFLRGREHAFLHTRSGNIEARNLLERAVTINADFAAALAFIAFTHVNDYINGWADLPEHSLQTGLEIAERAVQLDEEEPQAHFVVAVALLWRPGARQSSCRGAALSRHSAKFCRRTFGDRSHSDLQRKCRGSYQQDRRLHAARSIV